MDVLTFLIKDEPFWRIKKIYSFPSPQKNKTRQEFKSWKKDTRFCTGGAQNLNERKNILMRFSSMILSIHPLLCPTSTVLILFLAAPPAPPLPLQPPPSASWRIAFFFFFSQRDQRVVTLQTFFFFSPSRWVKKKKRKKTT